MRLSELVIDVLLFKASHRSISAQGTIYYNKVVDMIWAEATRSQALNLGTSQILNIIVRDLTSNFTDDHRVMIIG